MSAGLRKTRRKPFSRGKRLQRRAGVGDGDELVAARDFVVEIGALAGRLDGPARLAGDDEQRPVEVERALQRQDAARVRRVEDVQAREAGHRRRRWRG